MAKFGLLVAGKLASLSLCFSDAVTQDLAVNGMYRLSWTWSVLREELDQLPIVPTDERGVVDREDVVVS